MRQRMVVGGVFALVVLMHPLAAAAAAIRTELAGNTLAEYPFFESVRAFNVDAPVEVAIDPTRFPAVVGDTCDVFVVAHKSPSQWGSDPSLVDVTPGGPQSESFVAGSIQANTFQVTAPSQLSADAGLGIGVGYDVVLDCDQDGTLGDGDFIDGLGGEAGFYRVHDISSAGPLAVTEVAYNLDAGVAAGFGIVGTMLGQDLYFPTNVAAMGKLPLVVVSHGNGHNFQWYDHIGNHLASYGYVVMSHANHTGPGPFTASTTTLGHTDAFLDQAEAGAIAGGALVGHLDPERIVWIGHSRGGEGVAIAYDRLFDGTHAPTHFARPGIRLISSMLPTDFEGTDVANPHDASYHLWTASGDSDVSGAAGSSCCQTFRIHDRATRYRQSTVVQGTGHGWYHDEDAAGAVFTGPCPLDENLTHRIQLAHLLALAAHYVHGNVPALDFLTRQYERFRPIGVPTGNPCIVVSHEYRNGATVGSFVIDDYQTETGTGTSSSGASVTFDVENLTEGRLDDNNSDFAWTATDPFNGATQGLATDTTRGVVFDWTDSDRFYEWQVPPGERDFTRFLVLSFRGAQGTQHPNTLAVLGDLTFDVTLRDGDGVSRSIDVGAYGGGLEQPYQRSGGWHNEMETIRLRTTDFLHDGSGLDLTNVVAVRLDVGPSHGSSRGRIVVDELMLTNDVSPLALRIVEPTTPRPSFAGTSVFGSRVLVRLVAGGGLDLSAVNLTFFVDGVALTPAQIPTPATQVGGETWAIIAPGPRPDGCYDLSVSLATPSGVSAAEPQSLCYADDEAREFDRVLAIDQTNSMLYDGRTGNPDPAKMEAARAAARFFVDLSNPLDQIGVISFQRRDQDENGSIVEPDELAEPKFALVVAGEGAGDQRPAARAAADLISPDTSPGFFGPETSPGAGLVEARTMLDGGALPGHEQHVVLLTDGLENYPPFWNSPGPGSPLRPAFAGDDIRVDTVGIGGDADDVLLEDIAAATDGEFRNLNEGAGSFELLSRLADWYKTVDEDVRGEQRFFYAEGYPTTSVGIRDGKLLFGSFLVEPGLDWMTVAFHADVDHAATTILVAPATATPVVAAPPGVTVRVDPKHSVYRIREPQDGLWLYIVQPHVKTAEYFAVASAPTSLSARVGPKQPARRPGGEYAMPLRVWIADRESVRGASVAGTVRRPDGVKVPIALADDGLSADGGADDGIYGFEHLSTLPGPYLVHLVAKGASNEGEPFERYLSTAFVVPGQRKRPVQPGEGLPVPPRGEGCSCDAEARFAFSLFAGTAIPHGSFDMVADPSISLGVKAEVRVPALGSHGTLGLYLGRDELARSGGGGGDFHLTHLSPEIQIAPWPRLCPRPSLHLGVGAYRDEDGDVELGFNAGAGLTVCLGRRFAFVARYDYRSIDAMSRDYSTVQAGLRFHF